MDPEQRQMSRRIEPDAVAAFVRDTLFAPERKLPVVGVTTTASEGRSLIDPDHFAAALNGLAEVVLFATGDATWALAEALPPRLEAYGGAVRIWWPGLRVDSHPHDHRLYFMRSPDDADLVFAQIVTAIKTRAGGAASVAASARVPSEPLRVELAIGDVVSGRVTNVREFGAFVELFPGVTGLVHKSEVDWTFVSDVAHFVAPGDVVTVKVLEIDKEQRRIDLSIKRAFGAQPTTQPQPLTTAPATGSPAGRAAVDRNDDKVRALSDQLAAAARERAELSEELSAELDAAAQDRKVLREQNQDLRKQLRVAEDRLRALERRASFADDALSSDRAFLLAVRLTYAKRFDEDDRRDHPLLRMRVGRGFLASLRDVGGVDLDKVLEVCTQVAADLAHELAAREVHQLHVGPRGSSTRVRARDGALAWRCALQVKTPSARRLHWWRTPGPEGAIEFAKVGLHDDFSIPE